jgi:hypothetical protein
MNDKLFPIIKRKLVPDPYEGERSVYEPGICMRAGCGEPRWQHPEKGALVLCQDHAEEVFRGEAKAPPLRPVRDYVSVGRKVFLVEQLPEDLKKPGE